MHNVIFVTAPSKKEAECIAEGILKAKLAACVNIVDNVVSVFWWEGKVDKASELLLVVKTRKPLIKKIIKRVKSLHGYTVPEIIALPIIAGFKGYLDWIDDSTK